MEGGAGPTLSMFADIPWSSATIAVGEVTSRWEMVTVGETTRSERSRPDIERGNEGATTNHL